MRSTGAISNVSSDPANSVHEGGGIADESGRDLDNEGFAFDVSLGYLNNVQYVIALKMSNVQEESLREQKKHRRRALILEIARGLIAV